MFFLKTKFLNLYNTNVHEQIFTKAMHGENRDNVTKNLKTAIEAMKVSYRNSKIVSPQD